MGDYYNVHELTDSNGDGVTNSTYNLPGDEPDGNYPLAAKTDNYSINPVSVEFSPFAELNSDNDFHLKQNHPNPFNPQTMTDYQLSAISSAKSTIYHSLGQKVRTLVNEPKNAGGYSVQWNGKNDLSELAPGGIYFYTQESGEDIIISKRMIMIK